MAPFRRSVQPRAAAYIMPPMPPMSGMPPPAGASSFGLSATIASVVMRSEATEAASSRAVRTTLAGSITPKENMSPYSSVWALNPNELSLDSRIFAGHNRAVDACVLGDLTDRVLRARAARWRCRHPGRSLHRTGRQATSHPARAPRHRRQRCLPERPHGLREGRLRRESLLLFHFDLGHAAPTLDHGDTAGKLGHALLELLAIVIRRGRFLDLHTDFEKPDL